jgi:hypothetical protein
VHHAQCGQANATGYKHPDNSIGPVFGNFTVGGIPGLYNQVKVPGRTCPVMDMNRPGIVSKIAPIIPENAELHNQHWNQHPKVQVPVFVISGRSWESVPGNTGDGWLFKAFGG